MFAAIGVNARGARLTSGSVRAGVDRTLARLAALTRTAGYLVGAGVAVIGMAPPAEPVWVRSVVGGVLLWVAVSAWWTLRRPGWLLTAVDVSVIATLCQAREHLVPADVLSGGAGTGWVDIVAGTGVCVAQWSLRQPWGALSGLFIAGAAGAAYGAWEAPLVLAETTVFVAVATVVLRREATANDVARKKEAVARRAAVVRASTRADERDQQRRLHDTVLATLTMVNTGSIGRDSFALHRRARDDLLVIERLRGGPVGTSVAGGACSARLDLMLRAVASGAQPLGVTVDAPPVNLAREAAAAIGDSVGEAVANVARHAHTRTAGITVYRQGAGVRVVVRDTGVGFDEATVPAHRRGIRESIHGRMRSVGGDARVTSSPGSGTTVELWWPDDS